MDSTMGTNCVYQHLMEPYYFVKIYTGATCRPRTLRYVTLGLLCHRFIHSICITRVRKRPLACQHPVRDPQTEDADARIILENICVPTHFKLLPHTFKMLCKRSDSQKILCLYIMYKVNH